MQPGNNQGRGQGVIVLGGPSRSVPTRGPDRLSPPTASCLRPRYLGAALPAPPRSTLFDAATGKAIRRIESPQPIASFAFSPDSRTLATENANRTITIWEVASGTERRRLGKPSVAQPNQRAEMMGLAIAIDGIGVGSSDLAGPVGLAYSPDGRALTVRGSDGTVRVWDVAAGKEIGQFKGHSGRVEAVAFSSDGKTLVTSATDTTVLLWDAGGVLKDLSKLQAVELRAEEADPIWRDLANPDAAKAFQSMLKLEGARNTAFVT